MLLSRIVLTALLFPLTTGCILVDASDEGMPVSKLADASALTGTKLEVAETKLALAKLRSDKSRISAAEDLDSARAKLAEAELNLVSHQNVQAAIELGRARLDVDRTIGRASDARAELQELESMYAAEEFAALTKELVLNRSRRSLEQAERSLGFAQAEFAHLEAEKLPAKSRKLQRALDAARIAVQTAELDVESAGLESRVKLIEANREVDKLADDDKTDDE